MSNYNPRVWFQTSRKFRCIARLPEGETAIAALRRADYRAYAEARARFERDCAKTYLREHAEREGNERNLTIEEFEAFRNAGGRTYR